MSVVAVDLDGTLVDCRARQVAVAQRACGAPLDGERFWTLKRSGATTAEVLEALGRPPAVARVEAAAWTALIEEPDALILDRPLPAARPALELLRAAGHRIVVLTARRDAAAAAAEVDALGLGVLVDDLEVVSPRAPCDGKTAALAALGAHAAVGDSDAAAARAAGVRFAAVGSGQRCPAFLVARGVHPVHPDVLEAARTIVKEAR
jgi:phosphoglycolate phosphatase-like HAD superfamily hydrolase